ncbi:DUF4363 family protein [Aneurinibacillus sp. REN35]|uniref:DUF4363 family protein n=1 Tax=Aneurinibacillus sp. REN35 TaxID=3237286 RepID=UPI0035270B93
MNAVITAGRAWVCGFIALTLIFVGSMPSAQAARNIEQKPMFQKADQIEKLVGEKQWNKASVEAEALMNMYQKQKWKFQLLGDEAEYEGLNQEIAKLQAAIKVQGQVETHITIAAIKELLVQMYSM